MKTIFLIIGLTAFVACTNRQKNDGTNSTPSSTISEAIVQDGVLIRVQTETDTLKGSLKAYASSRIGDTNIAINYYSPATRGRLIWGGLVAYDQVWVTGAHKATCIEFDHDLMINGNLINAGKYALFTIPGREQWSIIINKNWNQHLADEYDQTEDVIRLAVFPETEDVHQERLRYVIEEENKRAGEITMYWDKIEISMPFEIAN